MTPEHTHWMAGIPVDLRGEAGAREAIACALDAPGARQMATANLDFLTRARRDAELRGVLARCTHVTADGMPVVLLQRIAGRKPRGRASGADLVYDIARACAARGVPIYLLGGGDGLAAKAAEHLLEHVPGLEVGGAEGPMVRLEDRAACLAIANRIRASGAHAVLVGLGCPKQEHFADRYGAETGARLLIGIGGTFDFLTGTRKRAPRWVQRIGMEWFVRMLQDPWRLGRRYAGNFLALPRLTLEAVLYRFGLGRGIPSPPTRASEAQSPPLKGVPRHATVDLESDTRTAAVPAGPRLQ